jgi:lipopolysaccharide transport system permease protein
MKTRTLSSPFKNPKIFWLSLYHEIISSSPIAWRILISKLQSRYRQSILGWAWAFLPSLITMLVFIFLQSQNILKIDDTGIPYPVYVLTGIVLWQGFIEALHSPLNMLWSSQSIMAKTRFPREALIMAGFGEVLFIFIIRSIMLLLVLAGFKVSLSLGAIFSILWILALLTQGLAFGLLLAPISLMYQDFRHTVDAFIPFWFLLTPIVYSQVPGNGLPALISRLNPTTPLLVAARDSITLGTNTHITSSTTVALASFLFLIMAMALFRVAMPRVIEHSNA